MVFWRSALTVGPWATEAMGLACSSSTPLLQLLVVPGNPGFCGFYDEFMLQLAQLFGRNNVEIMAVSHAGHDSAGLSQGKVWCLDSQIQHKVALLKERVLAPGRPPAVILAHSIGSYIMLQAVKQLEQELLAAGTHLHQQLPKVVLLMPFLATDWSSSRQRILRFAANFAPLLGSVAGAVGRLPHWLQDRLLRLVQPGVEQHAHGSIKALMTAGGVHNNLHLAQHEFRDLDRPADFGLISRLGQRAAVVCAPDDMWFPEQHYQQMRSALPGIEVGGSTGATSLHMLSAWRRASASKWQSLCMRQSQTACRTSLQSHHTVWALNTSWLQLQLQRWQKQHPKTHSSSRLTKQQQVQWTWTYW